MPDKQTVTFDASQWQPIETAPKEIELLGWREDCGVLLIMHTSYDRFASESECKEFDEATLFSKDWFGTAIPGWGERLEGSEIPTHWMPLPAAPGAAPTPAAQSAEQEAVAVVASWTNGSYSRNYKLRWLKDVPEGTQLYAAPVNGGERAKPSAWWAVAMEAAAALEIASYSMSNDAEAKQAAEGAAAFARKRANELWGERAADAQPSSFHRKWSETIKQMPMGAADAQQVGGEDLPEMIETADGKNALCTSGRCEGWIMYKHADGQWVSLRKALPSEIERAVALHRSRAALTSPAKVGGNERTAFVWPSHPNFPEPQHRDAIRGSLFTEHQMQGYANAYGEIVRAALSADGGDAQRLDWMCQHSAYMAFSRDGEVCWVMIEDPDEDSGRQFVTATGQVYDGTREAIDAAIAANQPGKGGEQ